MNINRIYGVAVIFVGAFFLIMAIAFDMAVNAPHPANTVVMAVSLFGAQIPIETAILLRNIFLVLGVVLAIIGTIVVLFGSSGVRVKRPKQQNAAVCGNCHATVPADAVRCPSCGVEFDEEK